MGSEYVEHHMSQDHRETPEYEQLGTEAKVQEYWRLSSIWNGKLTDTEGYTIGDFIDILTGLAKYATSSIRLQELIWKLQNNVINKKRCRKKSNKGLKNLVHLPKRTRVSHQLPPAVEQHSKQA